MPVLPQPIPPFPTPVRTALTLPSRDDLVARYSAAIGDVSAYSLPRTLKGIREGTDGQTSPFEAQMSDGKWHIVTQTPDGRREQIITAEGGWVKAEKDKDFTKMSDSSMEQFQMLANAFEPLSPLAIPKEVRILSKEKIGDHDTVIMTMRLDEKRRQRLFFDTSTGLLVRRQIFMRVPVGEVPQQIDYDDYRDLGGVKYPFTIRVSLVDPWVSNTRRYSEVRLGAKVDESVFTRPAGTQP